MCVLLPVASSICEWLMHEPVVPVYIFTGLVWNAKFLKCWAHSRRSAKRLFESQMHRGMQFCVWLQDRSCMLSARCMYLQKQQRRCIVRWEKQDGWICRGRCPHVSQSAGRKLHWHRYTNTHIAHNIHPICHPGPHGSWSNTSSLYFSWPCSALQFSRKLISSLWCKHLKARGRTFVSHCHWRSDRRDRMMALLNEFSLIS